MFCFLLLQTCLISTHAQNSSITTSNALSFDGSNDYLESSSMPTLTTQYTMMAWIKPEIISTLTLFGWGNSGASNASFLRISDGRLQTVQSNVAINGTTSIIAGQWVHVALTRNGNDFKIYLNGVLDGSGTQNAETNVKTFSIGNMIYNGSLYFHFNGVMDEFALWNTELSAASISAYKESGMVGSESGLVLYHTFNQGTANGDNTGILSVTDNTTSGINDSNIANMALTGTSSNFVVFDATVLSLNKNEKLNNYTVYPNPAKTDITIKTSNSLVSTISLYSITGQLILSKPNTLSSEMNLNISALKTGLYVLKIENETGTVYKKIIKE